MSDEKNSQEVYTHRLAHWKEQVKFARARFWLACLVILIEAVLIVWLVTK